jgi:hypothetical protein
MSARPSALEARGLRSAVELAAGKPHGTRIRYVAGCRCDECRHANTLYARKRAAERRAGNVGDIVPADKVRAHLAALSAAGIGRRTVHDVSGVAETVICNIIHGKRTRVRASTERAILAVTAAAAADGAYIDAKPTWKLINQLLRTGCTKASIALQLGAVTPALQINKRRITARKADDVRRLYERLHCVKAGPTLALLADLREEGFHRNRITRLLAALAERQGIATPDLQVVNDFIPASTAALVAQLHKELTE